MLLIHGVYHFDRKRTAAQKDFCNACEQERLSEEWRSFDWVHFYWVPLIPLGYKSRWLCAKCHKEPNGNYRTSQGAKIALLVAVAIFLLIFCISYPDPGEVVFFRWVRIISTIVILALLYWIIKSGPKIDGNEIRKNLVPLRVGCCIYCKGPLKSEPDLDCPACQVRFVGELVSEG
jgi:hypothetical protein